MRLDCTVEEGYRELAEEARELLGETVNSLSREIMRVDDEEDFPRPRREVLERKKKHRDAIHRWMGDLSRLKTRELTEK